MESGPGASEQEHLYFSALRLGPKLRNGATLLYRTQKVRYDRTDRVWFSYVSRQTARKQLFLYGIFSDAQEQNHRWRYRWRWLTGSVQSVSDLLTSGDEVLVVDAWVVHVMYHTRKDRSEDLQVGEHVLHNKNNNNHNNEYQICYSAYGRNRNTHTTRTSGVVWYMPLPVDEHADLLT